MRRKLFERDVNIDEDPVGEDVRHWPDAAGSGRLSPDSVRRLSISFKPKEPIFIGRRQSGNADGRPGCPDHP